MSTHRATYDERQTRLKAEARAYALNGTSTGVVYTELNKSNSTVPHAAAALAMLTPPTTPTVAVPTANQTNYSKVLAVIDNDNANDNNGKQHQKERQEYDDDASDDDDDNIYFDSSDDEAVEKRMHQRGNNRLMSSEPQNKEVHPKEKYLFTPIIRMIDERIQCQEQQKQQQRQCTQMVIKQEQQPIVTQQHERIQCQEQQKQQQQQCTQMVIKQEQQPIVTRQLHQSQDHHLSVLQQQQTSSDEKGGLPPSFPTNPPLVKSDIADDKKKKRQQKLKSALRLLEDVNVPPKNKASVSTVTAVAASSSTMGSTNNGRSSGSSNSNNRLKRKATQCNLNYSEASSKVGTRVATKTTNDSMKYCKEIGTNNATYILHIRIFRKEVLNCVGGGGETVLTHTVNLVSSDLEGCNNGGDILKKGVQLAKTYNSFLFTFDGELADKIKNNEKRITYNFNNLDPTSSQFQAMTLPDIMNGCHYNNGGETLLIEMTINDVIQRANNTVQQENFIW